MDIVVILLFAVGVSMDAFAVAISKGLCMDKVTPARSAVVGLWFGGFQAIMPFFGYLLGTVFKGFAEKGMPWISFALLVLIGGNMIKEALEKEEDVACSIEDRSLAPLTMLVMAIATSIDAFGVGITFVTEFDGWGQVVPAILAIGCTTFAFSFVGVQVGHVFGARRKKAAEIVGGCILILLGIKNILDMFGWLPDGML
ncbi:MAG: manganese efflux pump [Clostridia bacterium]|nr:manganese efflux pump [Clostridia bacterium]